MKFRLFAFLALVIPVGVLAFVAIEKRSGANAWEKTKADYIAGGESLETTSFFNAAPPAEDNFAAIPILVDITADNKDAEAKRQPLDFMGFSAKGEKFPFPKNLRRKGGLHNPRGKYNMRDLHKDFRNTGLLPVKNMPEDFAADILTAFEKDFGSTVSAMVKASERPEAVFLPVSKDRHNAEKSLFHMSSPQLQTSQSLGKGMRIYSTVAIHAAEAEKAAGGVIVGLRLAEANTTDTPLLIGDLVAIAIRAMTTESIWVGLQERVWDAGQLKRIEKQLAKVDSRAQLAAAIRTEAAWSLDLYDDIGTKKLPLAELGLPMNSAAAKISVKIWLDHNRASALEIYHHGLIAPLNNPKLSYQEIHDAYQEKFESVTDQWLSQPRTFLTQMSIPVYETLINRQARDQIFVNQALAACALERYYLAKKKYPDTLGELAPEFLAKIPIDPMDNRPMRYKKTNDGRYQLHSIGWDSEDNGGGEGDISWDCKVADPNAVER